MKNNVFVSGDAIIVEPGKYSVRIVQKERRLEGMNQSVGDELWSHIQKCSDMKRERQLKKTLGPGNRMP